MDLTTAPTTATAGPPRHVDFRVREAGWLAHAGLRPDVAVDDGPLPGEPTEDGPEPGVLTLVTTTGSARALDRGATDRLAGCPYPAVPADTAGTGVTLGARVDQAVAVATDVVRREPENPFNDHRGYASARARFPVQVFVSDHSGTGLVDPRSGVVQATGDTATAGPDGVTLSLTGSWSRVPSSYRWVRGSLVNLETGILLRALALGLHLAGAVATVRAPDAAWGEGRLARLGLRDPEDWTLPVQVDVGRPAPGPAQVGPVAGRDDRASASPHDPVLADVRALDRAQAPTGRACGPLGPGVPDGLVPPAGRPAGWDDVLWRRTSGRMPRGLFGMAGRRATVSAHTLDDAVRWASVPAPGGAVTDRALAATRTHVVVQGVDGRADGLYEVVDGVLRLRSASSGLARALEAHYGYPLAPGNGCDVRHATTVWFWSTRPADLRGQDGAAGWCEAQRAAGWAAHGVGLASAVHGQYSRPVRAFREAPTRQLLGLREDEMVLLAAVCGLPRPSGMVWDVRP